MKEYFSEKQKEEIAYFEANHDDWLKNPLYKDKYLIIYGEEIVGVYDHFDTAFIEADGKYRRGDYIIQELYDEKERINIVFPAIA